MNQARSTCIHMLAIVLGTLTLLVASFTVLEQPAAEGTAPTILWTEPNPGGLAANMTTTAWSQGGALVATGLSDRHVRVRNASNGAQVLDILGPRSLNGVGVVSFSSDDNYVGVQMRQGTSYIYVYRLSNAAFLGNLIATQDANGIWRYAADAALVSAVSGNGGVSLWRFSDFYVATITGSGYNKVSTVFRHSPDGTLQTATSQHRIRVQRTSDGATLATLTGDTAFFSNDSRVLATWSANPNRFQLWQVSGWVLLRTMTTPNNADGVTALRFTPNNKYLVSTGYEPFVDGEGLWQQQGVIRWWNVSTGSLALTFNGKTDIGVTSNVSWSPNAQGFVYGRYDGAVVAALSPF
jgi:WD40 repeat protein